MKKFFTKKNNSGFTLVEVLIASSIIVVSVLAVMSAAVKGIELSNRALKQTQANFILEEGAEAVRIIRDNNWENISTLSVDTNYYLSYDINTNTWSLGTTPVNQIDSIFDRTIIISSVNRDVNKDISESGDLDSGIKKVTINVSWNSNGENINKSLVFYLSDIFS